VLAIKEFYAALIPLQDEEDDLQVLLMFYCTYRYSLIAATQARP